MKTSIMLACLGFAFAVATPAFAGAQQEKMKGCNAEAKSANMKGEERKAFMKKCLSKDYELKKDAATPAKPATPATAAKPATPATPATPAKPAAAATQQDKMKVCNAEAKTKALQGTDRKLFMSACLKK